MPEPTVEWRVPKWATWRWQLVYRLLRAVPADEAERYVRERDEWQRRVSNACGATRHELHGGGAVVHGNINECVQQIVRLREQINGR